jgi:RimJ/RimL family protein N-acetyltransferase
VSLPQNTERLIVREFVADDLDMLAAVFADPAVLWWEPAPFTREQTAAWIQETQLQYEVAGIGAYAVVIAATGEIIGDCGPAYQEVEGERLPELGWDLRSDSWGHGYATEAARGVLLHAADLGLRRLWSLIAPHNVRSRAVAQRLGMTRERNVVWHNAPHELWRLDLP